MILDPYFASRTELPTQWIGKLLTFSTRPSCIAAQEVPPSEGGLAMSLCTREINRDRCVDKGWMNGLRLHFWLHFSGLVLCMADMNINDRARDALPRLLQINESNDTQFWSVCQMH